MTELEKRIGYRFNDPSLLEAALVTPSCRMERPDLEDNQRLEFLGDAVFGLLSADAVFAGCGGILEFDAVICKIR